MTEHLQQRKKAPFDTKSLHKYIACDACGKGCPKLRCSRCQFTYYCSAACQRQHWKQHKQQECSSVEQMKAEFSGFGSKLPVPAEKPVNTACGICLTEPIDSPWTLPKCQHGFCFACLCQWQAYCTRHQTWMPTAGGTKRNSTCPLCRADMEMGPTEQTVERASMYAARSLRPSLSEEERTEFTNLAVKEVDKILNHDAENLNALCLKGQILKHSDPEGAVRCFEKAIELNEKGTASFKNVESLRDQAEAARENDDEEEYSRLLDQASKLSEKLAHLHILGDGDLIEIKLEYAETRGLCGDWVESTMTYQDLIKCIGESTNLALSRRIYSGLSQCAYHLKNYDKALTGAHAALSINKRFPGVHMLVARALVARGSLSGAIRIMGQGILYEAPWDQLNRKKNIAFLLALRKREGDGSQR